MHAGEWVMAVVRSNSGRRLNQLWKVNARHALYHRDGTFYERLEEFPGALFDRDGYVLFETEVAFLSCPQLHIGQKVNVPAGINSIPTYRRIRTRGVGTAPAVAQGSGAGFGDSEENEIVEEAAIRVVTELYRTAGWSVNSVESVHCGF